MQHPIIVTIPASKLAEVEREEADVAKRMASGEKDICYYWQMGRLPKQEPNRIYFLWNGAVRAYHEVLFVSERDNRIYMKPEIHMLATPIQMKPFRGFRYM